MNERQFVWSSLTTRMAGQCGMVGLRHRHQIMTGIVIGISILGNGIKQQLPTACSHTSYAINAFVCTTLWRALGKYRSFLFVFFSFVAIPSLTPTTIKYEGLLRVITTALEGASDYHVNCKFKSPAMNPMEFVLTPCQRTAANIVQA